MYLDIQGTGEKGWDLYDKIIEDYDQFLDHNPRPQKPLLSGEEVMEILGLQQGEKVGEILKKLHEAQLEKTVTTKKEAVDFLKSF